MADQALQDHEKQTSDRAAEPADLNGAPAGSEDVAAKNPTLPCERVSYGESRLWYLTLIVLAALSLGIVALSYAQFVSDTKLPRSMFVLPGGLLVLVLLFGVYALSKTRELAELRGLVHGLEQRVTATPSVAQLEKLFDMVSRSQRGYRDLIDTFEDLLFSISLDGKIMAANRSFAALLGQPFADLVGKPLDEFLDRTDGQGRAVAERGLARFIEQRHWTGVIRIRLKHDGSTRFFQCTLHALTREGQDMGICVLARDITRERQNEARFTELFETLQEGVYLATFDGRFEDVNPALARMLGYQNHDDIVNRPLSDFLFDPAEWDAQQAELNQTGAINGREVVLRRRDGTLVTCLHGAVLIKDTGGHVRRHQGTLMDITERRKMEARLHREEEFARRLVQSFPDLVVALDRLGHYTFVSPRVTELLGYAPEELVGTTIGQSMDAHDRLQVREMFDSLLSGATSDGTIEYLLRHKSGDMRLFRANARPLFDSAGRIEGVISSARDITDAKRMEQQLIQTERLAAMGQMIAGVAHELNNPLTAVLGVTELLQDAIKDETSHHQLEIAHRQARRAAQIVQNLLSFARPPQTHKSCVHISDLIQRSLQLHEHSLRANNITVDFASSREDLPPVLGDTSQLTQVFLNMIANAEQAIREVRDHGTLRIRVTSLGENIVAAFQDDGVGIRRDILSKLFDPFFTTKRPGRGTGLGLSICLAILREHGGQIQAQPLSDGGAVFTVTLPIARGTSTFLTDSPSGQVGRPEPQQPPSPSERLAGCLVLVVDDEEAIRELVRDGLAARRLRVDTAGSAEEALSLVKLQRYDAILCDVNLRNSTNMLSGIDLYKQVNQLGDAAHAGAKPFFVFMSGELMDGAIEELPGTRTLQKPFRISELVALLADALVVNGAVKTS